MKSKIIKYNVRCVDTNDVEDIKTAFKEENVPCNISALIIEIINRLDELENMIIEIVEKNETKTLEVI
ncbi:MAG: hypothetical protein ACTSQ8_09315 [Candidatus Helarchaeota archaeon]